MKTYSESRIYKSWRKCWKNQVRFCNRSSPVSRKASTFLECCRSWKNALGKLVIAVNLEAIWFEFWMKSYSESRIELRNLQILKKMLEKSSQLLPSEQPWEQKKLGRCSENYRSWKNTLGKLVVTVNLEAIWSEFWMKERKWRRRFLSSVVGDSQISLI